MLHGRRRAEALKMSASKRMPHNSSDHDDDSSAPLPKESAEENELRHNNRDAKVTKDTWKGKLDFERDCTAVEPGQRCWLSAELTAWNKVMHGLAFEIVEPEPGKLRLQAMHNADGDIERSSTAISREASFLLSWLLEHHKCIDELSVFSYRTYYESLPVRLHYPLKFGPVRHMRSLEVSLSEFPLDNPFGGVFGDEPGLHWYELEGLGTLSGVEQLKISAPKIKFKLAAELETLLRRNSSTLKTVTMSNMKLPGNVSYALQCLTKCASLKLSLRYSWVHFPSMVSVAQLLRASTALRELSVYPIGEKRQVSAIADGVKANTSLKVLNVFIAEKRCTPEPLFAAMETSTTLKELRVSDCIINANCGQALTSALRKNCSLRDLYLADIAISSSSMKHLAEALLENRTLQRLHISGERLPMSGISALCMVLTKNKTLKKLAFADFRASKQGRETLAKQLVESECYDRVQLPWVAADMPGLLAVLTSPSVCPEELCLPDVQHLPEEDLKLLFDAVACSKHIHTFRASFEGNLGNRGTYLCEMLKANRSIKCLDIDIEKDSGTLVHDVLHTLAGNKSIIELMIGIGTIRRFRTAEHLSYFLAHNKTATKFFLSSTTCFCYEFVVEFAKGLWQNKLIVEFDLSRNLLCDDASFTVFETLRRNRGILNRAIEFVMLPRTDRQHAEAFELFWGKPCLLAHFIKVTRKTEAEALLALTSAEHYLQDNFLVITGVVQSSVKCHPGNDGIQIEKLNKECWRAIVQHLSLADVLVP